MKLSRIIVLFLLLCALTTPFSSYSATDDKPVTVPSFKFGTLPVLQSLPVFVAAEKGFFKEQGLNVEIILFNSAMEKDVAVTAGQIAGYFGDMMTPMVLLGNGTNIKITVTNFNTTANQRMFAILSAPQSKSKTLDDATRSGIATGTNNISEYLTFHLLQTHRAWNDSVNLVDIKSIPIRLQMLLSGQVSAALLPEPLATLAEIKGAKALADDKGQGHSATVLAFSGKFLKDYPRSVKGFHAAVDKAADYINKHPDEVRTIMNRECKIPEPLQGSFPIPKFPKVTTPSQKQIMDVYRWLKEKKIITKNMSYKDMVADGYTP